MKDMKKLLGFILILSFILVAGCGNNSDDGASGGTGEAYVIKYAHNQIVDSPQDQGAKIFKEKVEELSDGQITVEIYPNNQLGEMRELIEQTQNGQIEMTQQSLTVLSNFAPVLTLHDLPFLYPSEDALWESLDGEVGDIFNENLAEAGLIGLGFMSGGPKQFSANRPLRTLEDFQGLKMRALPAPIVIDTMTALGANPTPIEFSELYNSLQQNVVDSQENPVETVVNFNLFEVQDYVTITDHAWMTYGNVMNEQFWNSLSEELQGNVIEAMNHANEEQRKLMQESEEGFRDTITNETNAEIVELTEEEIEVLREATLEVHDKYGEEVGMETFEKIKEAIANYSN